MIDPADTIVLFEKLAYEDLLPVRWVPHAQQIDDVTAGNLAERNLRVLQACDALEEYGLTEKDDESPHSADLMRLDFKLNLLLDLAGQLLAQSQHPGRAGRDQAQFARRELEDRRRRRRSGTHGILEVGIARHRRAAAQSAGADRRGDEAR